MIFLVINFAKGKALKASSKIEKIKKIAENDTNIKKLYDYIISDKDLSFDSEIEKKLKKNVYNSPSFKKLSENETKIVIEIIDLIFETIGIQEAESLKNKIIDKYN